MNAKKLQAHQPRNLQHSSSVALLVDFHNVWYGLRGAGRHNATPKAIARTLLSVAGRFGEVAIAKAYFSEERLNRGIAQTFTTHGFEIIVPELKHKNPDVLMALDGQELLFTRPEINTYVLASGDSDFAPLARSIRARKKDLLPGQEWEHEITAQYVRAIVC